MYLYIHYLNIHIDIYDYNHIVGSTEKCDQFCYFNTIIVTITTLILIAVAANKSKKKLRRTKRRIVQENLRLH